MYEYDVMETVVPYQMIVMIDHEIVALILHLWETLANVRLNNY